MSELSKIKNRIQQAAGRDVNIIEGIGFDDQLGSAVSVTVIATGFETKKVNEPVTIKLEENDIDIDEEINKSDDNQNNFNSQQTLLLEEDELNDFENVKVQENNSEEDLLTKTVVSLDINEENIDDPQQFINEVIDDEITDDENQEIEDQTKEEELIEFETPQKVNLDNELNVSNAQSMRIEAREREERLREISIKLRTPSGLTKLEEEPAYKRNNIDLEETVHSSEDEVSSFTLEEKEDDIILNDNNSYLHDNVD